MADILYIEFIYFWYYFTLQFKQIFGYWTLGIVIGSLVSVFLKNKIHGMMASLNGKKMGIVGIIPAAALGILSALCMYGTIPIVASFSHRDDIKELHSILIIYSPKTVEYLFNKGKIISIIDEHHGGWNHSVQALNALKNYNNDLCKNVICQNKEQIEKSLIKLDPIDWEKNYSNNRTKKAIWDLKKLLECIIKFTENIVLKNALENILSDVLVLNK